MSSSTIPEPSAHALRLLVLGPTGLTGTDELRTAALLRQPKRVALLAYCALETSEGFCRRDRLASLLWPEFDQASARTYLRKSLFGLREALGEELFITRGDDEVRLNADLVWCDAVAVERCVATERWSEALALYRGDLLEGFFPEGVSQEFQEWLSATRRRLKDRVAQAAWKCAAVEEARGDRTAAVAFARRARELDPDSEEGVQRLLLLLDRLGDRGTALREYAQWKLRLRTEFGVEPAPETRWIANRLQEARRGESHETPPANVMRDFAGPAAIAPESPTEAAIPTSTTGRTRTNSSPHRLSRWRVLLGVGSVAVAAFVAGRYSTAVGRHPSLYVPPIRQLSAPGDDETTAALHEEIVTQLALDTSLVLRAAAEPSSTFVLELGIQRADSRVRVTARLVRRSDSRTFWATILDDSLNSTTLRPPEFAGTIVTDVRGALRTYRR